MLYRKISNKIEEFLKENDNKILLIDGARQVGKTYIVREVGKKLFKNFIEINLVDDFNTDKTFNSVKGVNDFYFQLSVLYGDKLDKKENTLIFIDEIQQNPNYLTMLKFLADDNKFTFICSGSLLGVTLSLTTSIPMGRVHIINMYPLDFEEFLIANGSNKFAIEMIKNAYLNNETLSDATHNYLMDTFKKYLIVGGMPEVVNTYLATNNFKKIREIQLELVDYYKIDCSKYDDENKLKIRRIYELIPSFMENKKKRVMYNQINNTKTIKQTYETEFEYLVSAGIALDVKAIAEPKFPLLQSSTKNLLKLYINDVGLLTALLYRDNIKAITDDLKSINLGAVYETVVAQELKAHNHNLYYYDNKSKGEVDYLIDDYDNLSILPILVKSGRDYKIHSALNNLIKDYSLKKSIILSNNKEVELKDNKLYLPIYYVMFI